MGKRGSESGQMRREDYEAQQDGEAEEAGVWKKASGDVLRKRKIIKVRRRKGPNTTAAAPSTKSNGIFGNLGASSTSDNKSTTGKGMFSGLSKFGQKSNDNAGTFKFGSAPAPNSNNSNIGSGGIFKFGSSNNNSNGTKATPVDNNTSFSMGAKTSSFSFNSGNNDNKYGSTSNNNSATKFGSAAPTGSSDTSNNTSGGDSESSINKIVALNLAFADWVENQQLKNPSISWAKGLQGYLKQVAGVIGKKTSTNNYSRSSTNNNSGNFAAPSSSDKQSNGATFNFNATSNTAAATNASSTLLFKKPEKVIATTTGKHMPTKEATTFSSSFGGNTNKMGNDGSGGGGDGKEKEIIKQRVKILRFRKGDTEQPWGDMGIHQVSIMTDASTKKSRILARDETPLAKLAINTNLYKGMKVDRSGKRDVQVYLFVEEDKMSMYSIRCKSGDIADKLCQTIKHAAEGTGSGDSTSSSNGNNNANKTPKVAHDVTENGSGSGGGGDGKEKEIIKQRVKILRFRKGDTEQPWGDMGIHQVSIMTDASTKKSRILARDETPLAKLAINTNLYKGMKVDRSGKRDVQVYLFVEEDKMSMYSIRCKSGDIADKLCQTIKHASASC